MVCSVFSHDPFHGRMNDHKKIQGVQLVGIVRCKDNVSAIIKGIDGIFKQVVVDDEIGNWRVAKIIDSQIELSNKTHNKQLIIEISQ